MNPVPELWREIFSVIAIAITFIAFGPYLWAIWRGTNRPHVFSWVIWALVTLVVFFAQLAGGGGVGAWPTAVSGVVTIVAAVMAWMKRGEATITRLDWAFLAGALAALPAWALSSDPLAAVIVLTVVDLLGFGPSFRKAFMAPGEEHIGLYSFGILRNIVHIAALEQLNFTTVLYPAAVFAACIVFVGYVLARRRALA